MTASEKANMEAEDAKYARPPQSFIDQCKVAGVEWHEDKGLFYLNELFLTYAEMIEIYQLSAGWNGAVGDSSYLRFRPNNLFLGLKIRTVIPAYKGNAWINISQMFQNSEVEILRLTRGKDVMALLSWAAFSGCKKLRKILDTFSLGGDCQYMFNGCESLEEVRMRPSSSLDLKDSPKLSLESIRFMIKNRNNGSTAITITLHPTAYARVTDELFAIASEKNITIATT